MLLELNQHLTTRAVPKCLMFVPANEAVELKDDVPACGLLKATTECDSWLVGAATGLDDDLSASSIKEHLISNGQTDRARGRVTFQG